jgi:hypothetical protein
MKFILMKIWKLTMEWKVNSLKRDNAGDDDEVAYFPGTSDQRPFEDYKRLKLCSSGDFGWR